MKIKELNLHFWSTVLLLTLPALLSLFSTPAFSAEPSFEQRRPFGVSWTSTYSMAVGDIDRDGDLDIISGNFDPVNGAGEQNVIYLNDGAGNFPTARNFGTGTDATASVAVGDMDGDGDLDIITGNVGDVFTQYVGGQNVVYLNDGAGNFSTSRDFGPATDSTMSVAVGDMDGDGDLDIITGNHNNFRGIGEQNVIYLNDGAGNFPTARNFGTGTDATASVAVGDMDGDGDLDIVTGNLGQQSVVYLNDGTANFTNPRIFGTATDVTVSVVVGDMDGDGDLDIATGNPGQQNMVYLNDGAANFPTARTFGTGTDNTVGLAAGDMDGDGDLDIITGNFTIAGNPGQQSVVYLNDGAANFLTLRNFGTGADATASVAAGDMDGDGNLDIITGNLGQQSVVYLNDGAGNFMTARSFGGGANNTTSVTVGDMDGDGDLDIITGNDLQQNVVYLNDGVGNFSTSRNFGTGTDYIHSVVVGDMDGDGDLDIVTANYNYIFIEGADQADVVFLNVVYLNDGAANFDGSRNFGSETNATGSMAVGDMDGDGDLDIITGNGDFDRITGNNSQNVLYLNDGAANFTPSPNFGSGTDHTASVAVGDMDGDGDLDIITSSYDQQNVVYLNDGGANFPTARNFGSGIGPSGRVAVGDMDGDGDLDIISGNFHQQSIVYLNDGVANFPTARNFGTETDATTSVAVGDMDSDGDLDIITGNNDQQSVVYLNDGAGNFTTSRFFGSGPDSTSSVVVGNMDSDSDLDIIAGNHHQQSVVYLNDGAANFTTSRILGTGVNVTQSVAVGDMDGDGDLDIITGNYGQHSVIYLNDGAGNFTTFRNFGAEPGASGSITVGDMDGDGDLDIVTGTLLYLNDGAANFGTLRNFGMNSGAVEVGDVDGDGDLDIIGSRVVFDPKGNFYNQDMVYLNEGEGIFSTFRDFGTEADNTASVAVGDVDGDGDLDFITGNYGQLDITTGQYFQRDVIYLNDGAGNFITSRDLGTGSGVTRSIAVGDMDGDGDLDIVTGKQGPGRLGGNQDVVYLNDGAGTFGSSRNFGTGTDHTRSVAVGDMDGDGDLDIVTSADEQNVVYLNDGAANFPTARTFGSGTDGILSVAVGDMDGDGNLDIIAGKVYLHGSYTSAATIKRPGITSNANFFSMADYLADPLIEIPYALHDIREEPVAKVRTCYSLDGSSQWQLAVEQGRSAPAAEEVVVPAKGCPYVPAWEEAIPPKATLAAGVPYTFTWDTFASGFFGQSDQVVFRIEAYPDLHPRPHRPAGPYQRPYVTATTFPFRVRGTQVQVVDPAGKGMSNALVYRIPAGQQVAGSLIGSGATVFRTSGQGYLQGRGEIGIGDQLLALEPVALPLTMTERFSDTLHLYYTNGTLANSTDGTTLVAKTVTEPGLQTLVVSQDNPLLLFDLDMALEWDASKDPIYRQQLVFDLQQTSRYLYDFTNGQVALGQVRVSQDADDWASAHVVIHATNRLRPFAVIGGAVVTNTLDFSPTLTITYTPGQVHMGSVWNRYGDPNNNPGLDWPLVLAHELSHYLLFLEDTYMGLDTPPEIGEEMLVNIATCPSAMGDVYNQENTEFIFDAQFWQTHCAKTLTAIELQRNEWQTIQGWYPWLIVPTQTLPGPTIMPFAFTTVQITNPITTTSVLANQDFFLDYAGGATGSSEARAFLLRDDNQDGTPDYIYDLGSAAGTQNLLRARGTQPNDQLCVFDRARQQAGCEVVREGDERINLVEHRDWNPVIQVTPVNSTTFTIQLTNLASNATPLNLKARVFPEFGTEPAVADLILVNGVYSGTLNLTDPALNGHVLILSDSTATAIVAYSIGGNPGNSRRAGGSDSRAGGGNSRRAGGGEMRGGPGNSRRAGGGDLHPGDAPLISPDGKLIFFATSDLHFAEGQFYTVQDMAGLPPLPAGKQVIGQGYNLVGTGFASVSQVLTGSLSIQYIGNDVLTEQADENQLTIHFWDGSQWQAVATHRDPVYNLVSARSQGPGIYALLAGVTQPLVTAINQRVIFTDVGSTLVLTGNHFLAPVSVVFQSAGTPVLTLPARLLDSTRLVVEIPAGPAGLPPQEYHMTVINGDQTSAVVPGTLTVLAKRPGCFYDEFESGANQWQIDGAWGIVVLPNGQGHALTDSPGGPYHDAGDYGDGSALTYTTTLTSSEFSVAACPEPALSFQHEYTLARLNQGADVARVEISTTTTPTWTEVASYSGGGVFGDGVIASETTTEWTGVSLKPVTIPLPVAAGFGNIRLRFSLTVNNDQITSRGWLIDDIQVLSVPTALETTPEPAPNQVNQVYLPLVAR